MKKLLSLFVTLIATCAICASNVITYTASEKLTETTSVSNSGLHTDAFNVVITDHTFSNGTGVITFANSLTSIGEKAFYGCSGLTSITIPITVMNIGNLAFYNCTNLKTVYNASTLNIIQGSPGNGYVAFYANAVYNDIQIQNNFVIRNDTILVRYLGSDNNVVIPSAIKNIMGYAFRDCTNMRSVTIPEAVSTIDKNAFYNCSSINSVTWNAINAHYDNISGTEGLFGYYNLTISNFIFGPKVAVIPGCLCAELQGLSSVVIPNSVKTIGNSAFRRCEQLTSVTMGNGVISIGDEAFDYCTKLTSIVIPNSVKSIGYAAFSNCSMLSSITIGDSISNFGSHVFSGCNALPVVNNLRYADKYLVEAVDKSLNTYAIKAGTKWIGYKAFSYCTALMFINIPESVTDIEADAFSNCSSLSSIVIPEGVKKVAGNAFYRCSGLTTVTWNAIDASVSSSVFYGVASNINITNLTFGEKVKVIPENLCYGCSGLTSITIPDSVTTIGSSAFYDCSGLTSITIPYSVTTIGSSAFYGCKNLKTVINLSPLNIIKGSWDYGCVAYYADNVYTGLPEVTILVSDSLMGSAFATYGEDQGTHFAQLPFGTQVELTATENYGYHFAQWSDGSTDNPHTVAICGNQTYTAIFEKNHYRLSTFVNNIDFGYVMANEDYGYMDEVIMTARPYSGCYFVQWNDGVTDNPRTFVITNDTTFTAEFMMANSGSCGDNLNWRYGGGTLTISGYGAMYDYSEYPAPWILFRDSIISLVLNDGITSIGESAFRECSGFTSLVIPNGVTNIGDYAFEECSDLNTVSLPESLETIGESAFVLCSGLRKIYCYAMNPPLVDYYSFDGVSQHAAIYVPKGTIEEYQFASGWDHFMHFYEISELPEGSPTDKVGVTVEGNYATFTWPVNPTASSYTLTITKNGEVFCTLTFNTLGQLVGMAFAPGRDGAAPARAAEQTAYGFSFVVSGIEVGSMYNFTFATKDSHNNVLSEESGSFAAKVTTGLNSVNESVSTPTKFLRDGQILIQRGNTTYDLRGQVIKL